MKNLSPTKPKLSNKKNCCLELISNKLHQCSPSLFDLSVFIVMKGYGAFFFSYQMLKFKKLKGFIGRKNTYKVLF